MKYRYKPLILVLAAVVLLPISSIALEIGPKTECPKKKKTQVDTVDIVDAENKFPQELQIQSTPTKKPEVKLAPEKVVYRPIENERNVPEQVGEEDPNSAMSFNFIYYIIDKFKFTDPLE